MLLCLLSSMNCGCIILFETCPFLALGSINLIECLDARVELSFKNESKQIIYGLCELSVG